MRILAVDDTPQTLRIVQRILVRAGHQVDVARTGSAAVQATLAGMYDVAVVDYRIPSPNGVEVLARIREINPACVNVLVSGDLDVSAVTNAVNRGDISHVLQKPFDASTLVAAVTNAIEARRRNAESWAALDAPRLEAERDALDTCLREHLALALQPIVNSGSREVRAYECLLRSTHPEFRGPMDVLDAAERHQRIGQLGAVVARLAGEHLDHIEPTARLFINLHPRELADAPALLQRLEPLRSHAHRIVLEITERSNLSMIEHWERTVQDLRDAGFAIAIDDVGAGYSSLSTLAAVDPDIIKVDMSIVRDVDRHSTRRRLLRLLCQLGMSVVAEGIETEAEAAVAEDCGVDLMQGYYFGRPTLGHQ